jgi:uncharacterized membrane protein YkvA (DUF1232 family)
MNFTQVLYDQYRKLIRDSKYRWVIIIGSALYLVTPFNLATDLVPIIGWIDDGIILTLLLTEVSAILMEKVKAKRDGSSDGVAGDSTGKTVTVDSVQVK